MELQILDLIRTFCLCDNVLKALKTSSNPQTKPFPCYAHLKQDMDLAICRAFSNSYGSSPHPPRNIGPDVLL